MKLKSVKTEALFNLRGALKAVTEPSRPNTRRESTWSNEDKKIWRDAKRLYSENLSREFSRAIETSLRSHFPETRSGEGMGTSAASAAGIKSVDVAFNIEGLFLGLGLSVKTIGIPEEKGGYGHNFKRVTEEWTTETVLYHRYMPVSIIVGLFFMPWNAVSDRPKTSSLCQAAEKFRGFQARASIREDFELMERIYVGLFKPDGTVRFLDVRTKLGPLQIPKESQLRTFEEIKDDLVRLFRERNPKLRVKGMPEVTEEGELTAPSPELDEAFEDG